MEELGSGAPQEAQLEHPLRDDAERAVVPGARAALQALVGVALDHEDVALDPLPLREERQEQLLPDGVGKVRDRLHPQARLPVDLTREPGAVDVEELEIGTGPEKFLR